MNLDGSQSLVYYLFLALQNTKHRHFVAEQFLPTLLSLVV